MKIFFMRHGETDWNKERRFQGRTDIPLNEKGIELAKVTADALSSVPFDRIYSSPLSRAYKTASIISDGRNIEVEIDPRLIELSFGEGEGERLSVIHTQPGTNLYNFIHHPELYTPLSGGETLEELYDRCLSFLQDIIFPLEDQCSNILVVGHGALIRGMIYHMNHRSISEFWNVTHKNCSVTISEYNKGTFTLLEEAKIYYQEDVPAIW